MKHHTPLKAPVNDKRPPDRTSGNLPAVSGHRRFPVVWAIVIDVLIGALALLVFSLFYFILPQDLSSHAEILPTQSSTTPSTTTASTTTTAASATSAETSATGTIQTTAAETTVPLSPWAAKFAGQFTDGEIIQTENTYRSSHVSVTIDKVQKDGVTYYVADIYVSELQYFQTALASDKYGKGYHDHTYVIAAQKNAILAVNGDYYSNNAGPVVRNGVLYRDQIYKDSLVMYLDGSMATFTADELNMDEIREKGAWQVWTFGPMLLDDGQPMEQFNSSVVPDNPRTAVGYYEPGHYCFVVVDGRQPGYSSGYSMKELSRLMYDLGCKVAFNLDGGQSSEMAFMGELANIPYHNGRGVSDIVMIVDGEVPGA